MKYYSFILLSAGRGTRFGKDTPKQYLPFSGKPMIVHTLENIDKIDEINEAIVVCENEYIEKIKAYLYDYRIKKKVVFVEGGKKRQESVYNGVLSATNENIILHEAARPLVTVSDIRALIKCDKENVTYFYDIPYTVLKKDNVNNVSDILKRAELINIQLPQKFNKKKLLNAHKKALKENKDFTEDAGLLYWFGETVFCLKGQAYNIKMTEYLDLKYGEMLLQENLIREIEE